MNARIEVVMGGKVLFEYEAPSEPQVESLIVDDQDKVAYRVRQVTHKIDYKIKDSYLRNLQKIVVTVEKIHYQ